LGFYHYTKKNAKSFFFQLLLLFSGYYLGSKNIARFRTQLVYIRTIPKNHGNSKTLQIKTLAIMV